MARAVALLCVVTALTLFLVLPAQAAYTKLYRFTNQTNTPMGGVRAVNNALEVITDEWAVPLVWGKANVNTLLLSGTYCTKLQWGGNPVPVDQTVKVGWTTSDNNCRLRDLRWVTTEGALGDSIVPTQTDGVPGGGQVTYDAAAGGYVWTITNDTGLPIDLSDVALLVFEEPKTVAALADYLWPGEGAMGLFRRGPLMRTMQDELPPHPDVVAIRVNAIIADHLDPLVAAVQDEEGKPHLPTADAQALTALLEDASSELEASKAVYDPTNQGPAEAHWNAAKDQLGAFSDQVTELWYRQYTWTTGPIPQGIWYDWCPGDVNSAGVVAGTSVRAVVGQPSHYMTWVWDSRLGPGGMQMLHDDTNWDDSIVYRINEAGLMCGAFKPLGDPNWHPCVWEPGGPGGYTFRDLTDPGWYNVQLYGVNDLGQAVGWGGRTGGGTWGALWTAAGGLQSLGTIYPLRHQQPGPDRRLSHHRLVRRPSSVPGLSP